MLETAVILITAHLFADFPLQPSWMIEKKRKWIVLLCHVGLVALVTAVLLGGLHWWILGVTAATHLVIDAAKVRLPTGRLWSEHGLFTLDQALHLSIAVALASYFPGAASAGMWWRLLPDEMIAWCMPGMAFVSGLILTVPVGGAFIGMATKRLRDQIESGPNEDGIANGGKYIGCLERGFILLLVMADQTAGIGFLIAAKSILRFGDTRDEAKNGAERRMTEYVIIGTLSSFLWGLLFSILTREAIRLWI